jgi:hypothetical protein
MTPEGVVKNKVRAFLKQPGVYYVTPNTGGYGVSGAPDFLVCIKGRFLGIECKAKGNTPTPLQEKALNDIRNAGGEALVIDENNLFMVERTIEKMKGYYGKSNKP